MRSVESAAAAGAGDLILRSGSRPIWRLPGGRLGPVPDTLKVFTGDIDTLASLLSGQITIGMEALRGNDMDFRAVCAGVAWRCNLSACSPRDGAVLDVFDRPELHAARSRDLCLTLRRLSSKPPKAEDLGLGNIDVWLPSSGLVLVSGIPGAGKSTLLAAVLGERVRTSAEVLVSYESPVEYDLQSEGGDGFLVQHDLPWDLRDPESPLGAADKHYAHAMRNVVRRAADMVFLGEVRTESTRVYRRLRILRGLEHEPSEALFPGGQGTGRTAAV